MPGLVRETCVVGPNTFLGEVFDKALKTGHAHVE